MLSSDAHVGALDGGQGQQRHLVAAGAEHAPVVAAAEQAVGGFAHRHGAARCALRNAAGRQPTRRRRRIGRGAQHVDAGGWEKGVVEKNVQDSRRRIWIDAAKQRFGSFTELNAWLGQRCRALWDEIRHPEHEQFSVAEMLEHRDAACAFASCQLRHCTRHLGRQSPTDTGAATSSPALRFAALYDDGGPLLQPRWVHRRDAGRVRSEEALGACRRSLCTSSRSPVRRGSPPVGSCRASGRRHPLSARWPDVKAIEIHHVKVGYVKPEGRTAVVLDDVSDASFPCRQYAARARRGGAVRAARGQRFLGQGCGGMPDREIPGRVDALTL
jgi:hypothetical protein